MIKQVCIVAAGVWIGLSSASALGWAHANAYGGGATYHAGDTTTRTNAWGGSATHVAGEGTEATTAYGGTAYHAEGSGQTEMYGAYGGSATHYAGYGTVGTTGYGAYHPPYYGTAYYPAYHPPTTVNYYSSSCGNCGGWSTAGAVAAGAIVGAAVATAATTTNTNNAYAAGYAAGATNTAYAMGAIYSTLPVGCAPAQVSGVNYYTCANTWFMPSFGANGVYYRVVTAP